MELDWSEQSPHIRTLFRPWQPGDGYDEATFQSEEARLGLPLPTTLQTFYRAWGRHHDMTQRHHSLLPPVHGFTRTEGIADRYLLCEENQACWYWGILREAFTEANPPVVAEVNESDEEGKTTPPWWPSHSRLSAFFDDLTYFHAFAQGALHGGYMDFLTPPPREAQMTWLEQHWRKASVTSLAFGLRRKPEDQWADPTLYVRDGQALYWLNGCHVAAREAEALDEIAQALQITWQRRW